MFSVLDIFQIQPALFQDTVVYSELFGFFFSHAFFSILLSSLIFISIFYIGLCLHPKIYPSSFFQMLSEISFLFIINNAQQKLGLKGHYFVNLFLLIFYFILLANLISLLPFSFTPTGQLVLTFFLSSSFFFFFLFYGFISHGWSFLMLFFPKMEPLGLRLAVALIEVLSFFIRLFSLSIRLFANMFAGHVLLHVIATVIYNSFVARQFYCFVHYTILLFSFIWA
jgi:F-type H+-transporting ATPase subunit a